MSAQVENKPKISNVLDAIVRWVGHAVSWLNVALIGVIISQVVMRYVFGRGLVILEELQWHLYAVGIIIGLSYCLSEDTHIRLDVFHEKFSPRTKEIIEIFGTLFLLMPLIFVVFLHGADFLLASIKVNEHSDAPMGLPWRWVIKSVIPIGFFLLFTAAISRLIRSFYFLIKGNDGVSNGS